MKYRIGCLCQLISKNFAFHREMSTTKKKHSINVIKCNVIKCNKNQKHGSQVQTFILNIKLKSCQACGMLMNAESYPRRPNHRGATVHSQYKTCWKWYTVSLYILT